MVYKIRAQVLLIRALGLVDFYHLGFLILSLQRSDQVVKNDLNV